MHLHLHKIIEGVQASTRELILTPPLVFEIRENQDDEGLYFDAEDETLSLCASARTLDELRAEVIAQLFMLWDEYAVCDDCKLTTAALRLKQRLLSSMQLKT